MNIPSIIKSPKIIHGLVIIIGLIILITNITEKAKAQSVNSIVGSTIITKLVSNEFEDQETEELIEETNDINSNAPSTPQKYIDDQNCIKSELSIGESSEEESELESGMQLSQENSALVKPDIITTSKIIRPRTEIVYHTVQPGETVSTIAEQYGISVNTILWENSLTAFSLIRPGDKLAILPFSGISYKVEAGDSLTKIAGRYSVPEKDIIEANKAIDLAQLKKGQSILIPGGRPISQVAKGEESSRRSISGLSVIKNLIKPKNIKVAKGNKMIWPTVGYRITQYYSWRHSGLDIANHTGTALYAADAGTVEIAGWQRGYGNTVVINHGGGKKTRYGHLSKFYVCKGQKVGKGEAIGAMGSTGRSTGPHLHFEVMVNGVKYNPLSFIR